MDRVKAELKEETEEGTNNFEIFLLSRHLIHFICAVIHLQSDSIIAE
jgi:hypothetical protein